LIGEEDVGEDRAGAEDEAAGGAVEDGRAGDVGGQQVGGALDAAGAGRDRLADRPREHRLAGAGVVLEEQVPVREQGRERQPHDVVLALEHRADVAHHELEALGKALSGQGFRRPLTWWHRWSSRR
jgi:hypothetical protein